MDSKGTIRTVATALCFQDFRQEKPGSTSRAEDIAQARFSAKIEQPDKTRNLIRRNAAWDEWLNSDIQLQPSTILGPNWASARILIYRWLSSFRLGPVSFTNGSEFIATRGFNSIESKLSKSEWTCSFGNFELWSDLVYGHRGLKLAMRRRYADWLAKHHIDKAYSDNALWQRWKYLPHSNRVIFDFKLSCVTTMTQGNRFSTVPKNNLVDRPICIEPMANILTQRRIGIGIRNCLKQIGVDLDILAEKHQNMISSKHYATVDLKNASDRIHLSLIRYLLPTRVFKILEQARSEMTLGFDDHYHVINKVSSMGNGFTFELMSLIIYALCRSYSHDVSVFGDDIVAPNDVAPQIVNDLTNAGFIVNTKKTHINDDYRESCGAHFIDGHGYVESYDFRYPTNIGECVTIVNKLSRLALLYPSFIGLYCKVYGAMPATLFAENPTKAVGFWHRRQEAFASPKLDQFTVQSPFQFRKDGIPMNRRARVKLRNFCHDIQIDPSGASMHLGFEWVDSGTAPTVVYPQSNWAKIQMYLASGRRVKNTITGKGTYKSFLVVTFKNGATFRWSEICRNS